MAARWTGPGARGQWCLRRPCALYLCRRGSRTCLARHWHIRRSWLALQSPIPKAPKLWPNRSRLPSQLSARSISFPYGLESKPLMSAHPCNDRTLSAGRSDPTAMLGQFLFDAKPYVGARRAPGGASVSVNQRREIGSSPARLNVSVKPLRDIAAVNGAADGSVLQTLPRWRHRTSAHGDCGSRPAVRVFADATGPCQRHRWSVAT